MKNYFRLHSLRECLLSFCGIFEDGLDHPVTYMSYTVTSCAKGEKHSPAVSAEKNGKPGRSCNGTRWIRSFRYLWSVLTKTLEITQVADISDSSLYTASATLFCYSNGRTGQAGAKGSITGATGTSPLRFKSFTRKNVVFSTRNVCWSCVLCNWYHSGNHNTVHTWAWGIVLCII